MAETRIPFSVSTTARIPTSTPPTGLPPGFVPLRYADIATESDPNSLSQLATVAEDFGTEEIKFLVDDGAFGGSTNPDQWALIAWDLRDAILGEVVAEHTQGPMTEIRAEVTLAPSGSSNIYLVAGLIDDTGDVTAGDQIRWSGLRWTTANARCVAGHETAFVAASFDNSLTDGWWGGIRYTPGTTAITLPYYWAGEIVTYPLRTDTYALAAGANNQAARAGIALHIGESTVPRFFLACGMSAALPGGAEEVRVRIGYQHYRRQGQAVQDDGPPAIAQGAWVLPGDY
jgi:hypothetical protein